MILWTRKFIINKAKLIKSSRSYSKSSTKPTRKATEITMVKDPESPGIQIDECIANPDQVAYTQSNTLGQSDDYMTVKK